MKKYRAKPAEALPAMWLPAWRARATPGETPDEKRDRLERRRKHWRERWKRTLGGF
jgi:hypothetical protein